MISTTGAQKCTSGVTKLGRRIQYYLIWRSLQDWLQSTYVDSGTGVQEKTNRK